jgi:DNA-binding SARP family transcriptional activator
VLHSTAYRLRRLLGRDALCCDGGSYALNPQATVRFDVREFLALTEPRPGAGADRRQRLEQALALYAGPVAIGTFGEWAEALRSTCAERYRAALLELAALAQTAGDAAGAVAYAEQAWAQDRCHEPAARALFAAQLLGVTAVRR